MKTAKVVLVIWMAVATPTLYGYPHIQKHSDNSKVKENDWILPENADVKMETSSHCASDVRCRCHVSTSGGIVADCSNLNISVIPNFHANVTRIFLQRNEIAHFKIKEGQLSNFTQYLDISDNKIESFIDEPFRNMNKLLHLDLSKNFLKYIPSVFPQNIFRGLKSLTYLNLKGNNDRHGNLRSENLTYPTSIGKIITLKTCLLDGVDPGGFSGKFKKLTQLELMDLGGHDGYCVLYNLKSNYFENVSSIQHLNLSYCDLRSFEKGTFRVLSRLSSLNISHNDRLTFRVLSSLTDDLQVLPISMLDISKIHCDYGPGTMMYVEDISKLSNHTYLTHLYAESNRLSLVEEGLIPELPKSLRVLSVKENRLTYGAYVWQISTAINLEYFDGSNQYTSHDPSIGTKDCNDWRAPPSKYGHDWQAQSSKHCSNCSIPTSKSNYEFPTPKLYLPPKLSRLEFFDSSLDYEIGRIPFEPNNMTYVDLHSNLLHSWKGPISNLQYVKYIDGSSNYCTYISDEFFDDCLNLETLVLHDNLLGNVLYKDTNGNIFRRLERLRSLDLSWNRIQAVPRLLLKNQSKLRRLNFSHNELPEFDLEFQHMSHLQNLNLSYNELNLLSDNVRRQIDNLKGRNLTVDLSRNQLQCSCETMDFLTWLGDNKEMFHNFQNYECRYSNGTNATFSDFENISVGLKKYCSDYTALIVGTTFAVVLAVSLTVSGLVYRFRWKLRYLYYMTRTRYRGYSGLMTNDDEKDEYPYDAFISYCEQDGRFIRHDLLNELENRRGLSLCLHQRDFMPGQDIAENITKAINQSRKTVAIVSRSYIESYWCRYEFNMARMESIYSRDGRCVLLLVFYESVNPEDLPFNVMDVIANESYIEYPRDEQGNVVFWEKLAETLSQ